MAYGLLASTVVSHPDLGGSTWRKKFMEVARDHFEEKQITYIQGKVSDGAE
jgi:hypothetical protein